MTSNRIRSIYRARGGGAGQDHADEMMALVAAEQAERPIDRPPTFEPPENPAWREPWWRKLLRWVGL